MSFSRNCKGGLNYLEGPICGKEKEKGLVIHTIVYFLDGLK